MSMTSQMVWTLGNSTCNESNRPQDPCKHPVQLYLTEAAKNKDKEGYLLCLVNLLRLVCWMANRSRIGVCPVCCLFTEA